MSMKYRLYIKHSIFKLRTSDLLFSAICDFSHVISTYISTVISFCALLKPFILEVVQDNGFNRKLIRTLFYLSGTPGITQTITWFWVSYTAPPWRSTHSTSGGVRNPPSTTDRTNYGGYNLRRPTEGRYKTAGLGRPKKFMDLGGNVETCLRESLRMPGSSERSDTYLEAGPRHQGEPDNGQDTTGRGGGGGGRGNVGGGCWGRTPTPLCTGRPGTE